MGRVAAKRAVLPAGQLRRVLGIAMLAAAVAPLAVSAQDSGVPGRYEIEVIVFENLEAAPGDPRAEVTTRVGPAADDAGGDDAPETGADPARRQARRLSEKDSAELQLEKARSRLEKAESYRPLIHRAWSQRSGDSDAERAVRLRSQSPLQPLPADVEGPVYAVDGTVALIERRYLHLRADLIFSEVEEAAPAALGGEQQALWQPLGPQRTMTRYRLTQSRRIETRTLTYFDHPRFGLLVEVRPAGTEQAQSEGEQQR